MDSNLLLDIKNIVIFKKIYSFNWKAKQIKTCPQIVNMLEAGTVAKCFACCNLSDSFSHHHNLAGANPKPAPRMNQEQRGQNTFT